MSVGRTGPQDLEYSHFRTALQVDGNGMTNGWADEYAIEGIQILDIDDITDRHEVAVVEDVQAVLTVGATETLSDSSATLRCQGELSAQPRRAVIGEADAPAETFDVEPLSGATSTSASGTTDTDDSADLLTRPMQVYGSLPRDDDTNGGESSASVMHDEVEGPLPGEWDFDRRDELFANLILGMNNVDVPISVEIAGSISWTVEEV